MKIKVEDVETALEKMEIRLEAIAEQVEMAVIAITDAIERLDETILTLESERRADWFGMQES